MVEVAPSDVTVRIRDKCNKKFVLTVITMGIICSIAFIISIGFSAAAWRNAKEVAVVESSETNILGRLGNIESNINTYGEMLSNIEDGNYERRVGEIEASLPGVNGDIGRMESRINANEGRISSIVLDDDDMEERIEANEGSIRSIVTANNDMEQTIEAIQATITDIRNDQKPAAFMAVMDRTFQPSQGDRVYRFNKETVDTGQNYSSYKFTCPRAGVYVFSFSIHSGAVGAAIYHTKLSGTLVLDGQPIAEVKSDLDTNAEHWQYLQAATTAVVECPTGGKVWVECKLMDDQNGDDECLDVQLWGDEDRPRSVFMGYSIKFD